MNHTLKVPEDYQAVMPYLIIPNADAFFDFMQVVFGATQQRKIMREGTNIIMHAEVLVNGCCIMYAQATEQWTQQNAGLFIYVTDSDKCYQKALDQGAVSVMPVGDMDYGRGGGVRDPFGNTWWITTDKGTL